MSRRESGRPFTSSTIPQTQNYRNTQTSSPYNEEMSETGYYPAAYTTSNVGIDDQYYTADKGGGYPTTSYRGSRSYSGSSYGNYYGNDPYENTRHSSQTPPTSNNMFDSYPSDPTYNDYNNIQSPPDGGIPYENYRGGNRYTELPESHQTDTYGGSYGEHTLENGFATKSPINPVASEPLSSKQRQQRKCCCCSRRICVFVTFFIIIALAIITFFVWPRIPSVSILPTATPTEAPIIQKNPAMVQMRFTLNAQIQNPENWVGIRFNKITADVYDVTTLSTYDFPIANTTITGYTLPPRTTTILPFELYVNYRGNNTSDAVVDDFLNACIPQNGAKATTLNIRADITLDLWGIGWIYKPKLSIGMSNFKCPFSNKSI